MTLVSVPRNGASIAIPTELAELEWASAAPDTEQCCCPHGCRCDHDNQ